MTTDSLNFGPWSDGAPFAQRHDAALAMRLFASVICGRLHPLTKALLRAEQAAPDALGALADALLDAGLELERLPALTRRRLLCSYAKHMTPPLEGRGRPPSKQRAGQGAERKGAAA